MYHCASAAALLASASEHKSSALVSSALLSSQQVLTDISGYCTVTIEGPSFLEYLEALGAVTLEAPAVTLEPPKVQVEI